LLLERNDSDVIKISRGAGARVEQRCHRGVVSDGDFAIERGFAVNGLLSKLGKSPAMSRASSVLEARSTLINCQA
jgi:hypothetical protein